MSATTFTNVIAAANELARVLRKSSASVAVSESAAGGLISAALVAIPGASDFYKGGMIVYTSSGRDVLFGGDPPPKNLRGATEEFAKVQAVRAKHLYQADWGIGETGATGPLGNPYGDPPGFGWVACSGAVEASFRLSTGIEERESNMYTFAIAALELTVQTIKA